MVLNERLGAVDSLEARVYRNGRLVDFRVPAPKTGVKASLVRLAKAFHFPTKYTDDLVVTVGKNDIAEYMNANWLYQAVGTGGCNVAAATNTSLVTEVYRVASTNMVVTTTVTGDTLMSCATFNIDNTYAIDEASIQKDNSGVPMMTRQTFTALNLVSGDVLFMIWRVSVA